MNTKNSLIIGAVVLLLTGAGIAMINSSSTMEAEDTSTTMVKPSTSPLAMLDSETPESNLVELVVGNDSFDVLEAAVVKADLVDALSGTGPLTVFAPTDAAFMAFTKTTTEAEAIAAVQALPVDALTNVLLYHVAEGRKDSTAVLAATQYMMLNKANLTQKELTTAGIATTDIAASNGIVHVINGVLSPAAM